MLHEMSVRKGADLAFSQIHKSVSTIVSTLSIVEIVRNDWFLEKLVVQVLS